MRTDVRVVRYGSAIVPPTVPADSALSDRRRDCWNWTVRTGIGTDVLSERVGFVRKKRVCQLEKVKVRKGRTVCSCRHSKSSEWVRSMYCVWRPYCVQL